MRVKDPSRNDMIGAHLVSNLQQQHVIYCNLLPLLGSVVAVVLALVYPPRTGEVVTLVVMWLLIGTGVSVGYHRYFTHQAFQAVMPVRVFLAVLGSMAAQGPILTWVGTHRRHHQFSDVAGDPHSPNLATGWWRGLWHAHFGWILSHDVPNPARYAAEILQDSNLMWVNRNYYKFVLLGHVLPGIALGLVRHDVMGFVNGFLWGGCLRTFLGSQFIWSINSLCHTIGSQPYKTRELSTNNGFLAIPTAGESWHNNHHAFPKSAALGHHWWQIDPGYIVIVLLKRTGLIWDVWVPSNARIDAKLNDTETNQSNVE